MQIRQMDRQLHQGRNSSKVTARNGRTMARAHNVMTARKVIGQQGQTVRREKNHKVVHLKAPLLKKVEIARRGIGHRVIVRKAAALTVTTVTAPTEARALKVVVVPQGRGRNPQHNNSNQILSIAHGNRRGLFV